MFAQLGGKRSKDAEVLYVVGVMCWLGPGWLWSGEDTEKLGRQCLVRASRLRPGGIPPEEFAGRGRYGDFFFEVASKGVLHSLAEMDTLVNRSVKFERWGWVLGFGIINIAMFMVRTDWKTQALYDGLILLAWGIFSLANWIRFRS